MIPILLVLLVHTLCIGALAVVVLQLSKERALNRLDPDGSVRARLHDKASEGGCA